MKNDSGGFLLSHTLPGAVPSAFTGLASRFGMGFWAFPRGYDHRKNISQPAKHASNDQNGLPAVFAAHTRTRHRGCFVCGVGSGLHSSYEQHFSLPTAKAVSVCLCCVK